MKTISAVLLACLVVAVLADVDVAWKEYKVKHGKIYNKPDDEAKARIRFAINHQLIEEHNARHGAGDEHYALGHNEFSDLSPKEMRETKFGLASYKSSKPRGIPIKLELLPPGRQTLSSIDYTTDRCMTPVKNQRSCGSCYAFSATGALEFYNCKKSGLANRNYSDQHIVDCSHGYGDLKCQGGHYLNSYDYLIYGAKGIANNTQYPYTATNGTCKFNPNTMRIGAITNYNYAQPKGNESVLAQMLTAAKGPINVCMNAGLSTFQLYKSGIYNDLRCTGPVNHAVLLVGYGSVNGTNFWKVKNSWGTDWGEAGYFRLARGYNRCGIGSTDYISYPVV